MLKNSFVHKLKLRGQACSHVYMERCCMYVKRFFVSTEVEQIFRTSFKPIARGLTEDKHKIGEGKLAG